MNKIVNFTVHKNTVERRRMREVRRTLMHHAREAAASDEPINGFAMVTWDKERNVSTCWHLGDAVPGNYMPEFVKVALMRRMFKVADNPATNPEDPDEAS